MIRRSLVIILALVCANTAHAYADTRGTVRLGMLPLNLEASSDTPLFGASVEKMIDRYNNAAAAHDRATGDSTPRINTADVGVNKTLLVAAPGLELGSDGVYFFRLEVPVGVADDVTSIGLGLYPINLQGSLGRSAVVYASFGGSASWLDRAGEGDLGALMTARAAGGVRIAQHVMFELGYNAFVLGGSYNKSRLNQMMDSMQLVEPRQIVSAGEARGIIDASLGVAF